MIYTGGLQEGGPKRVEELGIGDVVVAKSDDTHALYFGCRSHALRADFSHAAPAPVFDQLCGWASRVPLIEICTAAGVPVTSTREDRWSSGMLDGTASAPLVSKVSITPPLASGLAMGGLHAPSEQKVLVNLRGVSQMIANTFCQNRTMFDRSLPLAPIA